MSAGSSMKRNHFSFGEGGRGGGWRSTFLVADHLEGDAPEHCDAYKLQAWGAVDGV